MRSSLVDERQQFRGEPAYWEALAVDGDVVLEVDGGGEAEVADLDLEVRGQLAGSRREVEGDGPEVVEATHSRRYLVREFDECSLVL